MTDSPDTAVEAMAEILYQYNEWSVDVNGVPYERNHPWTSIGDNSQEGYRKEARTALEAAMPAIREAIAKEIQSHADYAKQYEPDSAFLVGLDTAVGLIRNPT